MLKLNRYIFVEISDKNLETYNEIINTIKTDFFDILSKIIIETDCSEIRKLVHKLVGIVSILIGTNSEINYILKSLLEIDKSSNNLELYRYHLDILKNFDTNKIF